jgi:glyoxylase-like metal-dependent hydrolase (beta-lactamase superfamily II)
MPGNASSPVMLMGPVMGDTIDHCLFYLPSEKTIICGDAVYGRSTNTWCEELENNSVLSAWRNLLDVIEGLDVDHVIPGHMDFDYPLDREKDLAHNKRYLKLFAEKIVSPEGLTLRTPGHSLIFSRTLSHPGLR